MSEQGSERSERQESAATGQADGASDVSAPRQYTMGMTVNRVGFMLERLGADCGDLQYLRELTENAIQAGASKINWDFDHSLHEATGVYKACIIDDGRGMTGAEMIEYINRLSSSGGVQALDQNFGLGAKIAAATRNPAGVVYQSWKDGIGAMIWLWRDPWTGEYGLRQFELPGGGYGYVIPLPDAAKPDIIDRHGTKVTLLGVNEADDTMAAPEGVPTASAWLARHLNERYLVLPEGVELRAREGWQHATDHKHRNQLRRVQGMRSFLDRHSDHAGVAELTGFRVHWWLLDDSEERRGNARVPRFGHVAALYQNELYELATGRGGTARLQLFGILFGSERVVLYIEPLGGEKRELSANTARTELRLNRAALPYAEWATEFRANMPRQLADYMETLSSGAKGRDHRATITDRLAPVMGLYRLSRYEGHRRPARGATQPGSRAAKRGTPAPRPQDRPADEPEGDLLAAMLGRQTRRSRSAKPTVEPPQIVWVSEVDGTRTPGFMEDRAAHYFPEQNMLQINADFRGFTDMVDHWTGRYNFKQQDHSVVVDQVREWFALTLVEVILGSRALEGERCWTPADVDATRSEEALTAAVLTRYHVYNSVKRGLGAKLGPLRDGGRG